MNWNKVLKTSNRRRKKEHEAYTQNFLLDNEEKKPQEIIEGQVRQKLSVVSKIADQGIDEKNQLKAAVSWLRFSRQLSEIKKLEIEGSLNLEARLTDALEKASKDKLSIVDSQGPEVKKIM